MKRKVLLIAAGAIASSVAGAVMAWAFWTGSATGSGAAASRALNAPTGVTATVPNPSVRTVHVTWVIPSTPDNSAPSGFTVSRSSGATTSAACGTGSAALPGTTTACDDTNVASGSYTYTVTMQWNTWTSTSSPSASVTVAASAFNGFTVSPSTSTPTAGTQFSVTLTAVDQYGATFTGYNGTKTVAWSGLSTSPAPASQAASYPATSVAFGSGVSTTTLTAIAYAGGANTLVATESAKSGSAPLTVAVGAATKLVFSTQPTTASSTASISPSPAVAVHDAYDNLVTANSSSVTMAIGTNAGGGTLSGTTTVAASSGVATFGGLSIDKAGTGYTLMAVGGSLTSATSSSFNINVGAAARLAFTQQPSGATSAGGVFPTQPKVTVQDAGGNAVTSYSTGITLAMGTNPTGATLTCTTNPVTPTSGVASFAGCKVSLAGNGYTLRATSGTLTLATSNTFNVTGVATKLVFTTQPGGGAAGVAWSQQPVVSVEDSNSNVVTADSGSVALALTAGTGGTGAVLSCSATTVTVSYGVGIFSGCSIQKTATTNTLTATRSGLTSGVSSAFTISAGPVTQLVWWTSPSTGTLAGSAFASQPLILFEDQYGNLNTTYVTPVTLTITTGTGTSGATLSCTANPATPVSGNGYVQFAGCSINTGGTGYTLTATSGSIPATASTSFDVFQSNPAVSLNNKAGGTQGKPEAGDTIVITYPNAMAATTFCGGWSGSTVLSHVTVSFTSSGGDQITGITDTTDCTGTSGFRATAGLGTIALSTNGKYFSSAGSFTNGTASWSSSTNTMTITLGTLTSGAVGTGANNTSGSYTPDASLGVSSAATFSLASTKQF